MDLLLFCCRRKQKQTLEQKPTRSIPKQHSQSGPPPPPPPQLTPTEISAGLSAAQILLIDAGRALISDCCLIIEEDEAISAPASSNSGASNSGNSGASNSSNDGGKNGLKIPADVENVAAARQIALESLKTAGVSSVDAAAKVLRISLIPRGAGPSDRAARLRYVKATAEKVFERLDEIQPESQEIRESRRKAIVTLQACERRADMAFSKLMQPQ